MASSVCGKGYEEYTHFVKSQWTVCPQKLGPQVVWWDHPKTFRSIFVGLGRLSSHTSGGVFAGKRTVVFGEKRELRVGDTALRKKGSMVKRVGCES